jgi:hypothetical protein
VGAGRSKRAQVETLGKLVPKGRDPRRSLR